MLVQFGNNWIQKIPLTAKLAVLGIFFIQLFPNWTACSPITYTNYIAVSSIQYCQHSYYSLIFKTDQLRINLDSFR